MMLVAVKINVNLRCNGGIMRGYLERRSEIMESQFQILKNELRKNNQTLDEWLEKCQGEFFLIKAALRGCKLETLATDDGIVFLISRSPCPRSQ
jgi:hypothetical protein